MSKPPHKKGKQVFTVTVLHATGVPDAQGDVIMPGAIKLRANRMHVFLNHKASQVVGMADIAMKGDQVVADMEVDAKYKGCYPSIGMRVIKSHKEGLRDNIRVIDEMEIMQVGISWQKNIDPNIKPL